MRGRRPDLGWVDAESRTKATVFGRHSCSGLQEEHPRMSNGIADQKADTNRDAESECPEVVSLRNQLSSREKELAGAVKIIQEIYASPGWKLIQRYRGWTQSQRLLRPRLFRRYEKAALWLLSKLEANPSIANGSRVAVAEEPVSGGGVLIQSRTGGYKQRVYYAKDGKRHWVPDPLWATQNGFRFPDDVQLVSDEHIAGLRQSSVAPHKWTAANWRNPTGAGASIREIATSRLSGCGIEFGAGESPMPIPLHCDVRYADRLPADKFASQYHPGEIIDAVIPDLVTGIDQMEGVPEKSLDFVVACHVIEHTPIPLLTFETVYSRLKEGGQFVLVVPDKQFTF